MTDERAEELRQAKIMISEELSRTRIGSFRIGETDPRIEQYAMEVAAHPDLHNLWEQLAVRRFLDMIRGYGLDKRSVRRFFTLYEELYFPGKRGKQRYRLTPVQSFQFASVYGFLHPDGRRVVKECVLYVPRKFSKTTGSASFAIHDLLFGDANAEIYIGANSQDQAKKCFDVIRGSLRKLDPNEKYYIVNEQMVKPTRRNRREAFAQCLTANARTKDGLNASTVIMDEFSQAKDSTLLSVLTTSMGVRENPLTVIITTASDVFDGPFYPMLDGYKDILLGHIEDDSVFAHLFEPDLGDPEDSMTTWRKVHPHLGITVREDFYEQAWVKAQRTGAEGMLAFRTKLLNIYAENSRRSWLGGELIRKISRKETPLDWTGSPLPGTIGIDLSVRGDFSAVTLEVYDEECATFHVHTEYFFPRGGLSGHPNELLYRKWESEGWLHIQESEVIDYEAIVEHVIHLSRQAMILAIGYDPYKSRQCVNMIGATDLGWALRPFPQTPGHFTSSVQSFEVMARTGKVTVNDNPINRYCFANAVLVTDSMENMKPYKRSENDRIDGVITALMCHQMFAETSRLVL